MGAAAGLADVVRDRQAFGISAKIVSTEGKSCCSGFPLSPVTRRWASDHSICSTEPGFPLSITPMEKLCQESH